MIVRTNKERITITKQSDHAVLAEDLAKFLKSNFISKETFKDLLYGINQHDNCWDVVDDSVTILNNQPLDFITYPLKEKIMLYKAGIDEIENQNPYAGLLVSKHFASFFPSTSKNQESLDFLSHEISRQSRIERELSSPKEIIERDFNLLQFFDNVSLYICLNESGTSKEQEYSWFKHGIPLGNELKDLLKKEKVDSNWIGQKITMVPFLLKSNLKVSFNEYEMDYNDFSNYLSTKSTIKTEKFQLSKRTVEITNLN